MQTDQLTTSFATIPYAKKSTEWTQPLGRFGTTGDDTVSEMSGEPGLDTYDEES